MPIVFKTEQKESSLHGLGLFALEDIPKGATWWYCDNSVNHVPCIKGPNTDNLIWDKRSFN